jgi:hypothetical protein
VCSRVLSLFRLALRFGSQVRPTCYTKFDQNQSYSSLLAKRQTILQSTAGRSVQLGARSYSRCARTVLCLLSLPGPSPHSNVPTHIGTMSSSKFHENPLNDGITEASVHQHSDGISFPSHIKIKFKLYCDRGSVGQFVLVSGPFGADFTFL